VLSLIRTLGLPLREPEPLSRTRTPGSPRHARGRWPTSFRFAKRVVAQRRFSDASRRQSRLVARPSSPPGTARRPQSTADSRLHCRRQACPSPGRSESGRFAPRTRSRPLRWCVRLYGSVSGCTVVCRTLRRGTVVMTPESRHPASPGRCGSRFARALGRPTHRPAFLDEPEPSTARRVVRPVVARSTRASSRTVPRPSRCRPGPRTGRRTRPGCRRRGTVPL